VLKLKWILLGIALLGQPGWGAEFLDETEKDFKLRSIGNLNITNVKGEIQVHGWALDKVRIRMKKKVNADTPEQANELFKGIDYRFDVSKDNIDISSQYGKMLSIEERLREKDKPRIQLDLMIFAPSSLRLKIWTADGRVSLKSWNSGAEIRSNNGEVRVEGLKGNHLEVLCTSCPISLKNIRSSVRCSGGAGSVELNTVNGKSIYAETSSGPIKLWHVEGNQLYSSKSGVIEGQFLDGKVEFHATQSAIDLKEIAGFLSGSVDSGNVNASIRTWEPQDKALIESLRGNINLTLPRRFSGDVDIWSVHGNTRLDFPLERYQDANLVGPEPENRLIGRIREGGELLKVFSETGQVHVFKREL
jgi:DUF4097 and DUF4098 domain-containing protein YvlB